MTTFAGWVTAVLIIKNVLCIVGEVLGLVAACMLDGAYERLKQGGGVAPSAIGIVVAGVHPAGVINSPKV